MAGLALATPRHRRVARAVAALRRGPGAVLVLLVGCVGVPFGNAVRAVSRLNLDARN